MPKGRRSSDEERAEVRRLRAEGVSVVDVAERVGVSKQSVTRWAPQRLVDGSGRSRILTSLVEQGPASTLDDLTQRIPDVDKHTAVHLLHSLKRAGLVRFDESGNGNGKAPRSIEATTVVARPDPAPAIVDETPVADDWPPLVGVTIITPEGSTTGTLRSDDVLVPDEPIPPPRPTFPLIQTLVERAGLLQVAATLLERAGQDELALAALAKVDDLSPLDREIIRLYGLAQSVGLVDEETR